jgi:hypothetical protein
MNKLGVKGKQLPLKKKRSYFIKTLMVLVIFIICIMLVYIMVKVKSEYYINDDKVSEKEFNMLKSKLIIEKKSIVDAYGTSADPDERFHTLIYNAVDKTGNSYEYKVSEGEDKTNYYINLIN